MHPTTRSVLSVGATLICFLFLILSARAQTPSLTQQLSRTFGFEEDADHDLLPDAWRLIAGRMNPLEPGGTLVSDSPHSGNRCFRIVPDAIPSTWQTVEPVLLDPRFAYRLAAWVKLRDIPDSGLRHTVVRIEAALLDHDDRPLATIPSSSLTGSTGSWRQLSVPIPPADHTIPRRLLVNLVIDGLALTGSVWFDHVTITPQPVIDLSVAPAAALLQPGDDTTLHVKLSSLTSPQYVLKLVLDSPRLPVAPAAPVTLAELPILPDVEQTAHLTTGLPLKSFGPYRIHASLLDRDSLVATRDFALAFMAPVNRGESYQGVIGAVFPADRSTLPTVAPALARAGLGVVLIDLWSSSFEPDQLPELRNRIDPALADLEAAGVRTGLVLDAVPDSVRSALLSDRRISAESPLSTLALFNQPERYWLPLLRQSTRAFGHRALFWVIGSTPDRDATPRETASALDNFSSRLVPLTYRRSVGVTVVSSDDPAPSSADFVLLQTDPESITTSLDRFSSTRLPCWVSLSVPAPTDSDPVALLKSVVLARASGATRIIIRPGTSLFDTDLHATQSLMVLASVARRLDGLDFVGDLTPDTSFSTLVFSDGRRTAAAVWTRNATSSTFQQNLGGRARCLDLWGNDIPLPRLNNNPILSAQALPCFFVDLDTDAVLKRLGEQTP